MSVENNLSLDFYKYLCQKIGYEEEVKVRRLNYTIDDLGIPSTKITKITSGSKGEGLQLNGSDLDMMYIDPLCKVYESENDVVPQSGLCIPLVMDTEDTHPCFTQLRLVNDHDLTFRREVIKNLFQERKFSSELYRIYWMEDLTHFDTEVSTSMVKIHGPCVSTATETVDLAWCLKCDKWISMAQPWISRPRTTWLSPELISKIISCGVLYVPIGYKGSRNENLQWRISFSVAEKNLIFSFNHIQLLCYALLKILVKEIVDKHDDLKNLLCSYFMKTLMFWMLEESDASMWRQDKLIPCFMACLKRLIYCVEYSTLLHYFIPENNLFYLRFDVDKKEKMISVLKNLYEQGISCFVQSETLYDLMKLPFNCTISSLVATLRAMSITIFRHAHQPFYLLYHYLHRSSSKISKAIFFQMLSFAHQVIPQISQNQPRSSNKHKYYKYKLDLGHLLIGTNSDAVAGWLLLASFYYAHGNHVISLAIINHALMKYTNEKIYPWQIGFNQNQENLLKFLKQAELCTISKALIIRYPKFYSKSPISPRELQLIRCEQYIPFNPLVFAIFLRFLCYYHQHKSRYFKQSLLQLRQTIMSLNTNRYYICKDLLSIICLGVAHQMIGETDCARQCFLLAFQIDERNLTSAAWWLSNCDVD